MTSFLLDGPNESVQAKNPDLPCEHARLIGPPTRDEMNSFGQESGRDVDQLKDTTSELPIDGTMDKKWLVDSAAERHMEQALGITVRLGLKD